MSPHQTTDRHNCSLKDLNLLFLFRCVVFCSLQREMRSISDSITSALLSGVNPTQLKQRRDDLELQIISLSGLYQKQQQQHQARSALASTSHQSSGPFRAFFDDSPTGGPEGRPHAARHSSGSSGGGVEDDVWGVGMRSRGFGDADPHTQQSVGGTWSSNSGGRGSGGGGVGDWGRVETFAKGVGDSEVFGGTEGPRTQASSRSGHMAASHSTTAFADDFSDVAELGEPSFGNMIHSGFQSIGIVLDHVCCMI